MSVRTIALSWRGGIVSQIEQASSREEQGAEASRTGTPQKHPVPSAGPQASLTALQWAAGNQAVLSLLQAKSAPDATRSCGQPRDDAFGTHRGVVNCERRNFKEVKIVLQETPSVVFPATCDGTGPRVDRKDPRAPYSREGISGACRGDRSVSRPSRSGIARLQRADAANRGLVWPRRTGLRVREHFIGWSQYFSGP